MPFTLNDDKVWLDSKIKLRQICVAVVTASVEGRNVVLLSHFETTVSQLARQLSILEIKYERFSLFDSSSACQAPSGRIWLGFARTMLTPSPLAATVKGVPLDVIVAEHHPLRSRDEAVIDVAEKLGCETSLTFHFSLDDPLMKHFGSTSIQDLFTRLGMPRDECIIHHLVSNAIRSAQEKLERQAPRDIAAPSAEEWFKFNVVK